MKPKKKPTKTRGEISLAELKPEDFTPVAAETFGKSLAKGARKKGK